MVQVTTAYRKHLAAAMQMQFRRFIHASYHFQYIAQIHDHRAVRLHKAGRVQFLHQFTNTFTNQSFAFVPHYLGIFVAGAQKYDLLDRNKANACTNGRFDPLQPRALPYTLFQASSQLVEHRIERGVGLEGAGQLVLQPFYRVSARRIASIGLTR